ncbi:unnamed protein product, partial [Mesorhabditis spiculigera]
MQRCNCSEEDCDAERLWTDFVAAATSIALLQLQPSPKGFQSAAAATTLLYKNSVDSHRKAFDRGFEEGRRSIAKELYNMYGGKIDVKRLVELLHNGPGGDKDHRRNSPGRHSIVSGDEEAALQFFIQALPALGGSPARGQTANSSELKGFLTSQLARRKRSRSPSSPSSHAFKKTRKM